MRVKTAQSFHRVFAAVLSASVAWVLVSIALGGLDLRAAQQPKDIEKKLKNRTLSWSPPKIDAKLHSSISSPPCVLVSVLEKASGRVNALAENLQNFASQEDISYETFDHWGFIADRGRETFDYVVDFQQRQGGLVVQESRNPRKGSSLSAITTQDIGLAEMALIFLPNMQNDYDMSCEATTEWERRTAWVVRFQQRKDKPGRTLAFRGGSAVYPAKLTGRAWIATDSGEVVHIEAGLMEEIPGTNVRNWYLSLSYAPVQFRTRDERIWLPQIVDAYCEFDDRRTIVYHTFTDFVLSSVQIDQKIEKPKEP